MSEELDREDLRDLWDTQTQREVRILWDRISTHEDCCVCVDCTKLAELMME